MKRWSVSLSVLPTYEQRQEVVVCHDLIGVMGIDDGKR